MKNLITPEQVIAEAVTFNANFDENYVRDSHIQAAGWEWVRNAFGTAMFDDMGSTARSFVSYDSAATFTTGEYVSYKYTDEHNRVQAGLYQSISGLNTGAPDVTTTDFSTASFFTTANYNTLYTNGLEKALAWGAILEALPLFHYKSGGHGIMTDAPEFEEAAVVKRQVEHCQKMLRIFMDEALDYVCNNPSDFPLYCPRYSNSNSSTPGVIFYDSDKQSRYRDYASGWRDYFNDMLSLNGR